MMQKIPSLKSFIIEGNIGAGKSTFLRLLQDQLPVQIVYEPLDQWQQVAGGQNLLDHFYKDTKRWAYTFQSYAFITRVMEQQKKALESKCGTQVLERSVYSDRYCFAKNCFDMGTMSPLEWSLYQEWFDWLIENYVAKPAGFIYLRTSPEVCFSRLKKRARAEESVIPLSYLKALHERHEEWLVEGKTVGMHLKGVPVLILETDIEFESDSVQMKQYLAQMAEFMEQTVPSSYNVSPEALSI